MAWKSSPYCGQRHDGRYGGANPKDTGAGYVGPETENMLVVTAG